MVSKKIESALNQQILLEASSSQYYMAMASWAETEGLSGVATFLYTQSDEERAHMLRLIKYVNERGGNALIPALKAQPQKFKSVQFVFEEVLKHEIIVSNEINNMVGVCLQEKDYTTHNFLQWYVSEQIEEEALARTILDKLKLLANDKSGLYLFDRDLPSMTVKSSNSQA
jgi:ferritin